MSKRRKSRGLQTKSPPVLHPEPTAPGSRTVVATRVTAYEGPIPPAAEMDRYEQIEPGMAGRIVAMAERSLEASIEDRRELRSLARRDLEARTDAIRRGQQFALISSLTGVAATLIAVMLGSQSVGMVLAGTTIVVLVSSFLGVRKAKDSAAPE